MVLFGGAFWGVGGMFLAIPLTAIVKVVADRVEPLKPFGYLLGDDQPHMASDTVSACPERSYARRNRRKASRRCCNSRRNSD